MRILMLSRSFPMPLNTGEKIRVYNIIKELSKFHDVYLITLVHRESDLEYLRELKQICKKVYPYKLNFSKKLSALKSLFFKYPWDVVAFRNKELKTKVNELLALEDFDIIWINFLSMIDNIDFNLVKGRTVILDQHNVDELYWKIFSKSSNNFALRLFANINLRKLKRFQREIIDKISLVFSVSDDDAKFMRERIPAQNKVWVVPNGVDLDYFQPSNKNCKEENVIMFCGSMDVTMNVEAALMFANEIFPSIEETIPNSQFYIVGRKPTKQICALSKQKNIIVTGNVDDVRPYYEKASIFVAPFKLGGGTKLKILEAMAMKVPIVTTSLGCQGIKVTNNTNIIIEDENKNFSDAVIRLLRNQNEREKLIENGRKFVQKKYSWMSIIEDLNKNLSKIKNNKRGHN